MEANLTGAPIDASNTDNLVVAEEANDYEAIASVAKSSNDMEIDIEEEHKIEAYQETMNIDIENIETFKLATNNIQNSGGKPTKLYNKSSLMKMTFFRRIFKGIARIM